MRPIHKILMATDFSPSSVEALRVAASMARRYDATLTILSAIQVPVFPLLPDAPIIAGPKLLTELMDRVDDALRDAKATVHGAKITTKIVEGLPAEAILREARAGDFDLIVVGTHGRKGIARAMIGSVAEHVVRAAPCPVIVARAPDSVAEAA